MKTPLLSLFVLFTFQTFINAQNWAPVGAKWTYTYTKFWSPEISYNIVESVGDTTINGKSCRILRSEKEACDMPWEDGNQVDFYMYDENDTVYYYNPDLNDFTILYDFNAQVGDEWITEMPQSQFNVADVPVFVRVDSVGIVAAAGMDLKIWHVTYYVNGGGFQNQYKSAIVEKWGDLQSFFYNQIDMTTLCDGEYNTGLRCYEDPDFGFIQYVDYPCDTVYVYTSVKEAEKYVSFSVFPSLTDGVVHIQLEDANDGLRLVEIVHLSGQIIEAFSFAPNDEKQQLDINLKGYPSGGYWVRVRSEKGTGVRKVFKK